MLNILKKIFSQFRLISENSPERYIDLGNGLPWFDEYRNQKCPPLSQFFGLSKDGQKKIQATIGKTAYYQTPKGKRWAVTAEYFDEETNKSYTFYCPEFEYDPYYDYTKGSKLTMYVDMNDYGKYEMPVY